MPSAYWSYFDTTHLLPHGDSLSHEDALAHADSHLRRTSKSHADSLTKTHSLTHSRRLTKTPSPFRGLGSSTLCTGWSSFFFRLFVFSFCRFFVFSFFRFFVFSFFRFFVFSFFLFFFFSLFSFFVWGCVLVREVEAPSPATKHRHRTTGCCECRGTFYFTGEGGKAQTHRGRAGRLSEIAHPAAAAAAAAAAAKRSSNRLKHSPEQCQMPPCQ